MLRKAVYPYKIMVDLEKFNETTYLKKKKKNVYYRYYRCRLHAYAKTVCKDFQIKNLGEYHDLYLKSDTLLLSDGFENFRKTCLKVYHLDPVKFLQAPGLAWQAALKKNKSKIRIINWYCYAVNGWKRNQEEYVMQFIDM